MAPIAQTKGHVDVSFLLPCRGREAALRRSVGSIMDTAKGSEFEILLAIDDDDEGLLRALEAEPLPARNVIAVGPRQGYEFLHRYVNGLCRLASGKWLWLWNDDVLMQTEGWDELIAGHTGNFVVLNPETNHAGHPRSNCIFPIVPRAWYELLGHFSHSNHNDTYVETIANRLGIRVDVPILLLHDRFDLTGNNNDQTARERVFTTGSFYGAEMQSLISRDAEVLSQALFSAVAGGQNS